MDWKKAGNGHYAAGRYADAVEAYTRGLEDRPDDAVLLVNRAQAHLRRHAFPAALADALRSTALDPVNPKGLTRAGTAHLRLGALAAAAEAFRGAAALGDPTAAAAAEDVERLQRDQREAEALYRRGEFLGCARRLQRLAQQSPHSPAVRSMFLEAASEAELWEELLDVLRPRGDDADLRADVPLCYGLAAALYHTAHFDDAAALLAHVLATDPTHAAAGALAQRTQVLQRHLAAGHLYLARRAGRWAYDSFTRAMAAEPAADIIEQYLHVQRAQALVQMERFTEAVEECGLALQGRAREWRAAALECRARCHEALGEVPAAIADYERVLEVRPDADTERRLCGLRQRRPKRKDYYATLGVTRDASPSEVKSGYRRLALQHHPDREAAGTEDVRDARKAKFQEISEAYTVLSDPTRKARYDAGESLETLLQPGGGGPDPFILFNVVCGVLPDDAALPLRALHRLKQCGFWTAVCVMGATTCPCWCPALWCAPAPRDRD